MNMLLYFVLLMSSFTGSVLSAVGDNTSSTFESVEVRIAELSPAGEKAGYAVPASGESSFTYPDLPECSDGIDNDGDGTVDHVDADGAWVLLSRWYGSEEECSEACITYDLPFAANANGDQCTSGERRILQAREQHSGTNIFTYGCWPSCSGNHDGAGTYEQHSSFANFCYSPGQKRDSDGTDRTVACHCELPLQESEPDDAGCSSLTDDSEADPPVVTLLVRTNGGAWGGSSITIDPIDEIEFNWESDFATSCSATSNPAGGDFSTGSAVDGTDSTIEEPAAGGSTTYTVICYGASGESASDSITVTTTQGGSVSLDADPEYVRVGNDVSLVWNTGTNDPATCTLVGPDVNLASLPAVSSSSDVTIYGESTFTLTCPGGTDTATVKILPTVQET